MKNIVSVFIASALGLAFAGCGGGGSGALSSPQPSTASHGGSSSAQNVTINVSVPGRTTAAKRRAAYVGFGTQSITVGVVAQGTTPAPPAASTTGTCNMTTLQCSASIAVFAGSNTFTVNLYDGTGGTGNLLSTGSSTVTISPTNAAVSMTFNGVPSAVTVSPYIFTGGYGETTTLALAILDADGNLIVGPGQFSNANGNLLSITLASSSTHVALSQTTFSTPPANGIAPTTFSATYDGTAIASPVTVTAAIGSGAAQPAGSLVIATSPMGIALSSGMLPLTSGGTGTVQLIDPGFTGTFTANAAACAGAATASSTAPTGPYATFTVSGVSSTGGLPCPIMFSDGTTPSVPLLVTVM